MKRFLVFVAVTLLLVGVVRFLWRAGGPLSGLTSPPSETYYEFARRGSDGGSFVLSEGGRFALSVVSDASYVGAFIDLAIFDTGTQRVISKRNYKSPSASASNPSGLLFLASAGWTAPEEVRVSISVATGLNTRSCWRAIVAVAPDWSWIEEDCSQTQLKASDPEPETTLPSQADDGPYLGNNVVWRGPPAWSPNGQVIAFNIVERPEWPDGWHTDLRIVNAKSGKRLEQMAMLGLVGWLPDGSLLVRQHHWQVRRVPAAYFDRY